MPFADPISSVVISGLANGASSLLDRAPAEAESGWDSMRDKYLYRNDAAGTDPHAAVAAFMVRGSQVSGKNMWVVSRAARCVALGIFVVEVVSMGLLSDRGDRVRYDAGANSQSGQNIAVTGEGTFANLAAQESQVTCDIEYIVTAGLTPDNAAFYTAAVGEAEDPPTDWKPTVKDSIWDYLAEFTYHYPNGWVLMGSSIENLPGLDTVWLIRDRYQYIYAVSP
jgi:hypothetical protein